MIDASATSPFVNGQNALLKAYAEDHWSETNPDPHALWPRLSDVAESNNCQQSSWFLRDGSFLRLKQAEIRIFFAGRIDPESPPEHFACLYQR